MTPPCRSSTDPVISAIPLNGPRSCSMVQVDFIFARVAAADSFAAAHFQIAGEIVGGVELFIGTGAADQVYRFGGVPLRRARRAGRVPQASCDGIFAANALVKSPADRCA